MKKVVPSSSSDGEDASMAFLIMLYKTRNNSVRSVESQFRETNHSPKNVKDVVKKGSLKSESAFLVTDVLYTKKGEVSIFYRLW